MTNDPTGFRFSRNKNGEVIIHHHGKLAANLKGRTAQKFLVSTESTSEYALQLKMAKLTGNYKHGNERQGKSRG